MFLVDQVNVILDELLLIILFINLHFLKIASISQQKFWPCQEDRLIRTILMIPHKLLLISKQFYCWGLWLDLKLTHKFVGMSFELS